MKIIGTLFILFIIVLAIIDYKNMTSEDIVWCIFGIIAIISFTYFDITGGEDTGHEGYA